MHHYGASDNNDKFEKAYVMLETKKSNLTIEKRTKGSAS